ncbi:hypothetical protein SAMCFNEI73_Ch3580 [Sinorhizobium americanum]|uniref:Uncharacterized protein n=1 Tax=Sinorhizobium americanum TaxID=194963 RepID=A0A1L3LRV9_9HYPH|nr:hypothetical protein SAMCFNEI73_Ch3580 [Sinorhizobium americanum]
MFCNQWLEGSHRSLGKCVALRRIETGSRQYEQKQPRNA